MFLGHSFKSQIVRFYKNVSQYELKIEIFNLWTTLKLFYWIKVNKVWWLVKGDDAHVNTMWYNQKVMMSLKCRWFKIQCICICSVSIKWFYTDIQYIEIKYFIMSYN
jgi:hypothetical protein